VLQVAEALNWDDWSQRSGGDNSPKVNGLQVANDTWKKMWSDRMIDVTHKNM